MGTIKLSCRNMSEHGYNKQPTDCPSSLIKKSLYAFCQASKEQSKNQIAKKTDLIEPRCHFFQLQSLKNEFTSCMSVK